MSSKYDVLHSRDTRHIKDPSKTHANLRIRNDPETKKRMNICVRKGSTSNKEMSKFFVRGEKVYLTNESCNVVDSENLVRQWCILVCLHPCFDVAMNMLITIHCVLFSQMDFFRRSSPSNSRLNTAFYVFNSLYLLEVGIKILALGFHKGGSSFLSSKYNLTDLLCVLTFLLSLFLPSAAHFEILKLYRVTCTLRQYLGFKNLDLLMKTMRNSFDYIVTILALVSIMLLLFTVQGQSMFQGRLNYRCRYTPRPVDGAWPVNPGIRHFCRNSINSMGVTCPPSNTCGSDYEYASLIKPENFLVYMKKTEMNFGLTQYDNFVSSMMTSFQVMHLTHWHEILYLFQGFSPAPLSILYVVMLIIVCNYFIANMLVAATMENYRKLTLDREPPMIVGGDTKDIQEIWGKVSYFSTLKWAFQQVFMYEFSKKEIWSK